MSAVFLSGGNGFWTGLLVAGLFSAAMPLVAYFRQTRWVYLLSLLAAALYYGHAFSGFLLVAGIAYLPARWLASHASPAGRWRATGIALLLLIALFTLGRVLHWDQASFPHTGGAVYVLDMWLVLRLVTFYWEVGSGKVAKIISLRRYITWVCLPFCLAGPLVRYSEMSFDVLPRSSVWKSIGWWREFAAGAAVFALGMALPIVPTVLLPGAAHNHLWRAAWTGLVAGPLGFYFTTAGYFRMMETLAKPAGIKLPPSFNYPIGRENISAFWMNWNMTATFVFRDYLFYNRWGRRSYNIFFNTLLLFTMVGLWHAANAYWILWGMLHGLLFCGFLLWRRHEKRLSGLPLRHTAVSRAGARVFTYLCVCACWYLPSKIILRFSHL